jgi:hypothetical protein
MGINAEAPAALNFSNHPVNENCIPLLPLVFAHDPAYGGQQPD